MTARQAAVVVRDRGETWANRMADAFTSTGVAPLLVTAPCTEAQRAAFREHFDDVFEVEDPFDSTQLHAAALALAERTRLDLRGMTTCSDGVIVPTIAAAHALGLRAGGAAAFEAARDKHRMRRVFERHGCANPAFELLRCPDDLPAGADRVGLPAVLKPISGTAGHGVVRVESLEELQAGYAAMAATLHDEPQLAEMYAGAARRREEGQPDPRHAALLEAALVGPELCVDLVVRGDEVEVTPIIDKFLIDDRFFECGFRHPASLDARTAALVEAEVRRAIGALGLQDTVAHVEVIVDERLGPTVVEVNAGRPGGQLISELLRLVAGVDIVGEMVSIAVGAAPPPRPAPPLPIPLATLSIFPDRDGRLIEIRGLDAVADLPDVYGVYPLVGPGALLSTAFETFAVVVLADASDGDDALRELREQAVGLVEFVVEYDS